MAETKKVVRLAKVAREINVGIETITAHLLKKGFEVESKPTTKLTPEMYDVLITDFKSSIALKEKANQISLRTKRERETKKVDDLEVVKVPSSDNSSNKRNRAKETPSKIEPEIQKPIPILDKETIELPNTESISNVSEETNTSKTVDSHQKKESVTEVIPQTLIGKNDVQSNEEFKNVNSDKSVELEKQTETENKKIEAIADEKVLVVEDKKEIEKSTENIEPAKVIEADSVIEEVKETKEDRQQVAVVEKKENSSESKQEDYSIQDTSKAVKEDINTTVEKQNGASDTSLQESNVAKNEALVTKDEVQKIEGEKEQEVMVKEEKQENVISSTEIELAGPKVIGKIDLSGTNWKTRPDKKKKRKERKRRPTTTTETDKVVNRRQEETKEGEDRGIKERPKVHLKGPKVVGKIDLSSTQDKKDDSEGTTDGGDKPKRRRRKRIIKSSDRKVAIKKSDRPAVSNSTSTPSKDGPNEKTLRVKKRRKKKPQNTSFANRNNEATEVSAKEIQDKIKATMAKLSGTSKGKSNRAKLRKQKREQAAIKRDLVEDEETNILSVTEFISVNEFAKLMDVAVNKVITTCFNLGIIVSINQRLDAEVIELVADEFGFEVEFINVTEQDEEEDYFDDAPEDLESRAPVVTVMGHVDHGKTSLLDYIRNANVIAGEMGGITQHIGAYEVTTESGKEITFLDTPGHEAFTAMRARGAKVTDIAVIVIAADDDIMPQTKEAISHAQAAGVPMIFAINKVDKDTAQPEKIKQQLAAMNLLVEDWGGKYQSQEISAKFGTNVDDLLEKILLEAELLELKANPNREAIGTVLEASLDKGRGYVSNILIQNGSLNVGDTVLAGQHVGKVKAMFNERGQRVKKSVGPATPVTILGLNGAPQAGDRVKVMKSEQEAKAIATKRAQIIREQGFRASKHITLEEIGRRLKIGTFKELNLIVKGDMDGSVEALTDSLLKLSTEEIRINVIHKGVGAITESDVLLASASDAIIVGFQVRPTVNARRNAEQESIEIRTYSIIYAAIEEIKSAMEGMLEPKVEERFVCNLEVREVFKISKVGAVAGCYVTVGKINKDTRIHLLRDGIIVFTGEIETLKRYKDDVKEVLPGQDCGIRIKNFNDIKPGDVIEGFEEIEIKRTL
ncbi:MAG: translation initiation factor IF-2 [Chitinophagales bacterium]